MTGEESSHSARLQVGEEYVDALLEPEKDREYRRTLSAVRSCSHGEGPNEASVSVKRIIRFEQDDVEQPNNWSQVWMARENSSLEDTENHLLITSTDEEDICNLRSYHEWYVSNNKAGAYVKFKVYSDELDNELLLGSGRNSTHIKTLQQHKRCATYLTHLNISRWICNWTLHLEPYK